MGQSFKKELCLANEKLSFAVRSPMSGIVYDFNKNHKQNIVTNKDDYIYLMNEYGKRLREVDPDNPQAINSEMNLDQTLALRNNRYSKFVDPELADENEERIIFGEKASEIEKIDSDESGFILVYMKNGKIKKVGAEEQNKTETTKKEKPQEKIAIARRRLIE